MSEGIEIEVMGHKGKITRLVPRVAEADPCLGPGDVISVWVEFEPPVNGTRGMYVDIPARDYTRDELVAAVIRKVEASFERDRKVKEERARREARERGLQALVDGVKKAVGLGEEAR